MSDFVNTDKTTIHEYVTSPSLDPVEARTADSHGIYPIDPLGFPNTNVCGDSAECLSRGNPEFPQSPNFSVEDANYVIGEYVEIPVNVKPLSGNSIFIPVNGLECVGDENDFYKVTVPGNPGEMLDSAFRFANAGYEDYSVTGLLGVDFTADSRTYDAEHDVTTLIVPRGDPQEQRVDGRIGPDRIKVEQAIPNSTILLTGQDNPVENGLYTVDNGTWFRRASVGRVKGQNFAEGEDPYDHVESLDNSQVCGHVRHSYSDGEVAERVAEQTREVIGNTLHPLSRSGDLAGAGALTRWFVECGPVQLGSAHEGGDTVTVEGFGLGGYASGECNYGDTCPPRRKPVGDGLPVDRPLTVFNISTNRDDATAIPRDWPFTTFSNYASAETDNNITLLKKFANRLYDNDGQRSGPVDSASCVGGLVHDIYDTCETCGGTGEVDGSPCPDCDGEGRLVVGHSESNRIHICVNNDFKDVGDGEPHLKKTYVHLPAPIDTPDGDEFEVTVSLPIINPGQAFGNGVERDAVANRVKQLSAYYEYVSQPRVYVLSGNWKFSESSLSWDLGTSTPASTGSFEITGENVVPLVDRDGVALPTGIRIRFTLDGGSNCPRHADVMGTLETNEAGNVTIVDLEGYPYGNRLRDRRMRICGVAYLDPNDDCETNRLYGTGTSTLMGLHTRNEATLGSSDMGEGNGIGRYNKILSPTSSDNGRVALVDDGRRVVATVYPTTTNTFPWAIVGRHKMRHLDRLMTDEWDLGEHSVSSMIWHENKKIIDFNDTVGFFGYGDVGGGQNGYGFTADTMPLVYARKNSGAEKSLVGSQLRIRIPDGSGSYRDAASNPVRQARKAVEMLASDFRKMRLAREYKKIPGISRSSRMGTNPEYPGSFHDIFLSGWTRASGEPTDEVINNKLAGAAWQIKARHLPDYIRASGQDQYADGNSIVGADPFVDGEVGARYSENIYGNGEYWTSASATPIPCDYKLAAWPKEMFGYRSVINARIESDSDAVRHELFRDACRVAELQITGLKDWAPGGDFDITEPYANLIGASESEMWKDIYSATANVFSVDTIPSPGSATLNQDLLEYLGKTNPQMLPLISGDAMATYLGYIEGLYVTQRAKIMGYDTEWEKILNIYFVSYNLPFIDGVPKSTALTKLLRSMVAPYGGHMPTRFWDSTRTGISQSGLMYPEGDVTDPVWRHIKLIDSTRIIWPETECCGEDDCDGLSGLDPTVRDAIVRDNFISRSTSAQWSGIDSNIHYASMRDDDGIPSVTNWSEPPVKVTRDWYSIFNGTGIFAGPSGYIRVYMKFKFSASAGRWYTVDYIQTPMSYLTPLYGANALEAKIDGVRVWTESICPPNRGWQDVLMHPYYKYPPMDINPSIIPKLISNMPASDKVELENNTDLPTSEVAIPRLAKPYLPIPSGGLGIVAPYDVNGGNTLSDSDWASKAHASFWAMRKHLRPATSVARGSDVPAVAYHDGAWVHDRAGGTMGDAVLWGQFDFPRKDQIQNANPVYRLPATNLSPEPRAFKFTVENKDVESPSSIYAVQKNGEKIELFHEMGRDTPIPEPVEVTGLKLVDGMPYLSIITIYGGEPQEEKYSDDPDFFRIIERSERYIRYEISDNVHGSAGSFNDYWLRVDFIW